MPKVKKIVFNSLPLNYNIEDELINATNPSDFAGEEFSSTEKAPTANCLRVLKSYVDSTIIPTGALTFDTSPTLNSNKPVTSDGIYRFVLQAIDNFFNEHFVVLTQAEYDALGEYDPSKFYMIYEPDNNQ